MTWRWEFQARVRRVVDADTLDLACDLGFGMTANVRVRVLGVNAPERNTPEGRAAELFAITLLGAHPQLTVRTELGKSFDRWLGEITLPDGSNYATRLIDAGHGTSYPGTSVSASTKKG